MDEHKIQEVGKTCILKARNYAQARNWSRAFPHYLMGLEIFPNVKANYEEEFVEVLYQLGIWLESRNQLEEVTKWYNVGLKYFPENVHILNNLGEFLLRTEQSEAALPYLKLSYTLNRNFLLADKNLQTAKLNILPRWHFRMLNDRVRNGAYQNAIQNNVTSNHNKVLDIGAGCGLLSFYTSQCKAVQNVTAIEASNTLCAIAAAALKDRNVSVINKHSTELSSSDVGLSNLLVTEIFDAGLFGEHVLRTLIHAWDNLLEPSAKVIPRRADLFVTGISSKTILARHRLCSTIAQLQLKDLCVTQRITEPYEAENLKQIDVEYITCTVKALSVDFVNVAQLKRLYTEYNCNPVFTLMCTKSGTIHAFAIWFDLYLDENIIITTNPLKNNVVCWEQAMIYLDHPLTLHKGEEVHLQLSCVANELKIKILNHTPMCNPCFKVSSDVITFLNDEQVIETALRLEVQKSRNNINILDLNPFPLFALYLAKKGYCGRYTFLLRNPQDWEFFNYIWYENGFLPADTCNLNASITFEMLTPSQLESQLTPQVYDVIFVNPISKNGTLCEDTFQKLPVLRSALKSDGLIFPQSIRLQVEVIDSDYLDFCNKVSDDNLLGFQIATQLNEYAVLEQWQLNLQQYQRKTLCSFASPCVNLQNNQGNLFSSINVTILENGVANGFLYWYILDFSPNVFIDTYKSFHYNDACFILKQPVNVNNGDVIKINIRKEQGLLKIDCEMDENENT